MRAALYLGRHEAGVLVSAGEVARALGTPANYTSKTLRRLAREGLLRSARGPNGGFGLRVSAAHLTLAALLDAVDERSQRPAPCLLGDRSCNEARSCGAHRRWLEVQVRLNEIMERTTLADLLADES